VLAAVLSDFTPFITSSVAGLGKLLDVWLLKTIGGRVIGGVVSALLLGLVFAAWQAGPEARGQWMASIGGAAAVVGKTLGWLALVGVAPWATYFLSTAAGRFQTNLAGIALVAAYTAVEAVLLAWMFNWQIQGGASWIFFSAATLIALLYNVLICDWIAERFGGQSA
jgi:hypothetical protein